MCLVWLFLGSDKRTYLSKILHLSYRMVCQNRWDLVTCFYLLANRWAHQIPLLHFSLITLDLYRECLTMYSPAARKWLPGILKNSLNSCQFFMGEVYVRNCKGFKSIFYKITHVAFRCFLCLCRPYCKSCIRLNFKRYKCIVPDKRSETCLLLNKKTRFYEYDWKQNMNIAKSKNIYAVAVINWY